MRPLFLISIGSAICLAQENIRATTFKIDERDLEKACKSQSCIVVELEEV